MAGLSPPGAHVIWLLLGLIGCERGEVAAPRSGPGHLVGWQGLLRAVARGDVPSAKILARDLSLGPVSDAHPGAEATAAALGYLQVASTPDDLSLALVRAAAGCAACHRDRGVIPPQPPAATHEAALARAAWGVVWDQPASLPADVQLPEAVRSAWARPDRLAAVVAACQGCHQEG